MENLSRVFQKQKIKKKHMKRLSFITLFKIEFLLPFTSCREVLGKMPGTGSGWLISMLVKLNWFCLTDLITLLLLMWKWIGLWLRKNCLWRCWSWLFLPSWIGALTLTILLKLPPRKLEPWFVLWSSFSWGYSVSL